MKVSLDGLLQNAAKATRGIYGHSLLELLENLKELRRRTQSGDMIALNEFFAIYVVKENEDERSVLSNNRPVV